MPIAGGGKSGYGPIAVTQSLIVEYDPHVMHRPQRARLPFWQTVAETYVHLFGYFAAFLARAWPWMIVAYVAIFFLGPLPISMTIFGYAKCIVLTACSVPVLVHWHRRILLGEVRGRTWRFGRRETHFLILGLVLAAFEGLPSWLVHNFGRQLDSSVPPYALPLAAVAASIALAFVTARLSLLFPAIAIGAPHFGVKHAWMISRGVTLRLFLGFSTILIPIIPVGWVLAGLKLIILHVGGIFIFFATVIDIAFLFLALGLIATFQALAFRRLVNPASGSENHISRPAAHSTRASSASS